jgi:hemerythrin
MPLMQAMEFFQWRDELSVGVYRLDQQHQNLIALLNKLYAAVQVGRPAGELRMLCSQLTLHTRLHFSDEEMIMEGAEYPRLREHRARHSEFTEGLLRLQQRLAKRGTNRYAEMMDYEFAWFASHQKADGEFGAWLRERTRKSDVVSEASSIPITQNA